MKVKKVITSESKNLFTLTDLSDLSEAEKGFLTWGGRRKFGAAALQILYFFELKNPISMNEIKVAYFRLYKKIPPYKSFFISTLTNIVKSGAIKLIDKNNLIYEKK